jgi:hypothetical protein
LIALLRMEPALTEALETEATRLLLFVEDQNRAAEESKRRIAAVKLVPVAPVAQQGLAPLPRPLPRVTEEQRQSIEEKRIHYRKKSEAGLAAKGNAMRLGESGWDRLCPGINKRYGGCTTKDLRDAVEILTQQMSKTKIICNNLSIISKELPAGKTLSQHYTWTQFEARLNKSK